MAPATHRAACPACDATLALAPGAPQGNTLAPARFLDAHAIVARGATVAALPTLPALIAYECPACDTRTVSE